MHKQINEINEEKHKGDKNLSDSQENTNVSMMEMMRTTQDLRTKFNKEIGTSKNTQTEDRLSDCKDTVTRLNRQGY